MGTNGLALASGCTRGVIRVCSGNLAAHPRKGRLRLRQNGTLEAINLEYDDDSLYLLLMLYMGHTLVQNVVIYCNQICGTPFVRHEQFVLFGGRKNPWVWMCGAGKPIRRLEYGRVIIAPSSPDTPLYI